MAVRSTAPVATASSSAASTRPRSVGAPAARSDAGDDRAHVADRRAGGQGLPLVERRQLIGDRPLATRPARSGSTAQPPTTADAGGGAPTSSGTSAAAPRRARARAAPAGRRGRPRSGPRAARGRARPCRGRCRARALRRRSRAGRPLAARTGRRRRARAGRDVRRRANARPPGSSAVAAEEPHERVGLGRARVHLERAAGGERLREAAHRRGARTSNVEVGAHRPGRGSTSPRADLGRARRRRGSRPRARPGRPASSRCSCVCSERIRARRSPGSIATSSPTSRQPPVSVPVTTVPAPVIVNTRSTNRRVRRRRGRRRAVEHRVERGAQLVEPLAGDRRDRHDRRAGERGAVELLADLLLGDRERLVVDEVALREGDHAARRRRARRGSAGAPRTAASSPRRRRRRTGRAAPGPTPASMLRMNRSWPGHVDEADLASARQLAPRVAEVDREAAALLLGPAVGVDAGEPHDQRRLAVVDVAGRRRRT